MISASNGPPGVKCILISWMLETPVAEMCDWAVKNFYMVFGPHRTPSVENSFTALFAFSFMIFYNETMKYLESRQDITGGELIIKGTRIRIAQALHMLANGVSVEQMHTEWWPWLTKKTIKGAIEEAIAQLERPLHA